MLCYVSCRINLCHYFNNDSSSHERLIRLCFEKNGRPKSDRKVPFRVQINGTVATLVYQGNPVAGS